MEIHLYLDDTDLQLPVLPQSFEITDPQNNESVNVLSVGDVTLIGKPGEKSLTIASMYPGEDNDYYFAQIKTKNPYTDFIDIISEWKDNGRKPVLSITGSNVNYPVTIEGITYMEDDHTGDVQYTLELKEYRSVNKRLVKSTKTIKYTTRSGDSLKKLAYKYLGATKYSGVIYDQNKKAIEKAVKAYIKKYNKKHPKAKLKYKSSEKGKHIVKGIKLVIKQEVE